RTSKSCTLPRPPAGTLPVFAKTSPAVDQFSMLVFGIDDGGPPPHTTKLPGAVALTTVMVRTAAAGGRTPSVPPAFVKVVPGHVLAAVPAVPPCVDQLNADASL